MRHLVLCAAAWLAACGSTTTSPTTPPDAASDVASAGDAADGDAGGPEEDIPGPPDTNPGGLPFGSTCERDDQCESGVCVQTRGITRGCGMPCARDLDCGGLDGRFTCAIDRPAGGGRFVCAEVDGATARGGDGCAADADCHSNLCADGVCRAACATDEECVAGERCGGLAVSGRAVRACRPPPVAGVTVEDYALFAGDTAVDSNTEAFPVAVPPDAVSLTFIAQDTAGQELFAAVSELRAPDRALWIDARTMDYLRDQPVREILHERQVNAALAPSSDGLRVLPGAYRARFTLFNDRAAGTTVRDRALRATVRIKRAPGGAMATGTLRLRVYFVGLRSGPTAVTAERTARWTSALTQVGRIFAAAGVRVEVAEYRDVTGADATRFAVIDTREELEQLFTRGRPDGGDTLDLFIVRGISSAAGLEHAIGVAGAVGGPPGVHGTIHSGVVAGWETTLGGRDLLPLTLAHECAHFLGLWHTRERVPGCTSATSRDCAPFGGVDPITDTPADATTSTRYLMHWQTDGTNALVTAGQGTVLRAHVLVR